MSDQQDTFLREVEDEVRRDRMAKLFDKYGVYALIVAGIVVGGVGGYKWYEAYQRDLAEKAGNRFTVAQRLIASEAEKDKADALKDLQSLAADGGSGYRTLARLQLAGRQLEAGDAKAARAVFEEIAGDPDADPRLKDYARLQAISIDAEAATDLAGVKSALAPLLDGQNMWRFSAREVLATTAMRLGRKDEANELLTGLLADPGAPSALRQRAEMLLSLLTAAAPPAAAVPAGPATTPAKAEDTKKPETEAKTPASPGESGQATPEKPAN